MEDNNPNQEKKEYLWSYLPLVNEIRYLEEQIAVFQKEMTSVKAQRYEEHIKGSNALDLSNVFEKEEKLLQKWMTARSKKIEKCSEIYFQIEQMEDKTEKAVLNMHYLQRLSFDKVAGKLGFSLRQIYRIHGRALEHFELPDREKVEGYGSS